MGSHLSVSDASCPDEVWSFQMQWHVKFPTKEQDGLEEQVFQWHNAYAHSSVTTVYRAKDSFYSTITQLKVM